MATNHDTSERMPVVRALSDFDSRSGTLLERIIFNHRLAVVISCIVVTLLLVAGAVWKLSMNASFEKMIPQSQPYIRNFLEHRKDLRGLGNALRIVVENPRGDIFDAQYQETLRKINDELFLTPGIDRAWLKSLWTPSVRWTEVTEEGFRGGPVMPEAYSGSAKDAEQLRLNIARAGIVGRFVGNDFKSSMLFVPLLDVDPQTGKPIDYRALSRSLEDNIRVRFGGDGQTAVRVHIIGFAKLVGDLIDGMTQVMAYFGVAALIAIGIIFAYTRCVRSTALVVACSAIAVAWQLGLVALLGFKLDPFSILVPFLIFAIGVSHGAQKMNGIMQDIGRGTHRLVAARYTFRRLFLAGMTALLADAVGFAVLMVIDIPVIQDLALTASVGVAVLIFTNLILLPVLLSYSGVSTAAAERSLRAEREENAGKGLAALWESLDRFTSRKWASAAIAVALLLGVGGFIVSLQLKIGDLEPGAPELRANSRYNKDIAYIAANYSLSSDMFAVIVKTGPEGCLNYQTLIEADRLAWELQQLPGVQTTVFLGNAVRQITAGSNEGSPKWQTIARNQDVLNYGAQQASVNNPDLFNNDCSVMPVIAYLADHKAETLRRRTRHAGAPVPARRRQCRHRGGDEHRRARREPQHAVLCVWRRDPAVFHHVSQLARGRRRHRAADPDVDFVRSADGRARHGRESRDAAGHCAGRRHRRRLRAVPAVDPARAAARRCAAGARVSALDPVHGQGRGARRHHARCRRGDLGLVADQIPG